MNHHHDLMKIELKPYKNGIEKNALHLCMYLYTTFVLGVDQMIIGIAIKQQLNSYTNSMRI